MFEKLKAAWSRLAGEGGGAESAEEPVEYTAPRPRPPSSRTAGLYQTAGIIEKDDAEGVKQHRFVRADTHQTKDAAVAFTISKAKQIIDLQGDRIFSSP